MRHIKIVLDDKLFKMIEKDKSKLRKFDENDNPIPISWEDYLLELFGFKNKKEVKA